MCFFFISPKGWLRTLPLVDGAVLSPDTRQGGCVTRTLITHALVVGKKHPREEAGKPLRLRWDPGRCLG